MQVQIEVTIATSYLMQQDSNYTIRTIKGRKKLDLYSTGSFCIYINMF